MERIRGGDWDALQELYQRFSPGVFQLARRRLNDERLAEDVVQEVFVRIWHYAGKWDAERGSVDAWIFVMTRHVVYDYLRAKPPTTGDAVAEAVLGRLVDPDDGIENFLANESLAGQLQGLSSEQRQVVRLIYVEGLSTRSAAEVLKIPQGTVKSRLRLALDHLRHQWEQEVHRNDAL